MTREESITRMAELRSECEELCKSYNEAVQSGNFEASSKKDGEIDGKIKEYAGIAKSVCFEDCKQAADPMIAAVTMLTYQVIGVKDEKRGDDKIPVRSIVDKDKTIDLIALHRYCGEIGNDRNWAHIAQKLNFLLTVQAAGKLAINPMEINTSFDMTETAKKYNYGKSPVSKTNLKKSLQIVVTAMLGDGYYIAAQDANYLTMIYTRKGRKALSVACADNRRFIGYIAEICHRIVTSKVYTLEYKAKRDTI